VIELAATSGLCMWQLLVFARSGRAENGGWAVFWGVLAVCIAVALSTT
jgi:hypothetical protein